MLREKGKRVKIKEFGCSGEEQDCYLRSRTTRSFRVSEKPGELDGR